jgi:hypothetical protein
MLDILNWLFADWRHYLGTLLFVLLILEGLEGVVKASRKGGE